MTHLKIIENLAVSVIDTAKKMGGETKANNEPYILAVDENWSELVHSSKVVYNDHQEAVEAFGHRSEWAKMAFTTAYQAETLRLARIILKHVADNESVPANY